MGKKVDHVDLFWLRMDRPENPMTITGIMTFTEPLSYEKLVGTLATGLKPFRRFSQKVVIPKRLFTRPYWEDDPAFSVEDHIECIEFPNGAGQSDLERLASQIISSELSMEKPLWKVTLVKNYGSGSALIARMHHSITDGISLVQVILSMTEPIEKSRKENEHFPVVSQPASNPQKEGLTRDREPGGKHLTSKQIVARFYEIVKLLFLPPDPQTIFKKPLGLQKTAIWTERFTSNQLREIVKKEKVAINDVLMSLTTGGLERYLEKHGQSTQISRLRAFVLYNLRTRQLDEELGNKFGVTFLELPVKESEPKERLNAVKRNMDAIKASEQAGATFWVQAILGATPVWMERFTSRILDSKGTVVLTNVPATRTQLAMAGVPIDTLMAWVPQSGRIGIGVSFVSYNGKVITGIDVDAGIIPDPRELEEYMYQEFLCLLDKCLED
jgi:diacylglycerol O-acyltransferase / wax synthase